MMPYRFALAVALVAIAPPAFAGPPEQLYVPGPEAGRWRLEYNGQAASSTRTERPHNVELWAGISDRLALGIEGEGEVSDAGFRVEEVAVQGMLALTPRDAAVEAALLLRAGIATNGDLTQIEGRLIASHRSDRWAALANFIARRETGDELESELAYGVALHRRIGKSMGLGIEASGSLARLAGFDDGYDRSHYLGPSLAVEIEPIEGRELELGVKLLRRLAGSDASRTTLQLAIELEF